MWTQKNKKTFFKKKETWAAAEICEKGKEERKSPE